MKQTKFKEFFALGGNQLCSAHINDWLKGIPSASVVHWTAVPHGEYGCRVIVEYIEDDTPPKSKVKRKTSSASNDNKDKAKKVTDEIELNLEDPLY